jgi:hypothetical protein
MILPDLVLVNLKQTEFYPVLQWVQRDRNMLINFFKQVFFIFISPDSFKITNHIKRYLLPRVGIQL